MKLRAILRPLRFPGLALLAVGLYLLALQLTGNVHEVVKGELIRSAQLPPKQLASVIDQYKVGSVLNLRGEHKGEKWYDDEVSVTKEHAAKHLDFKMSARRQLSEEDAVKLINLMKKAPKPLLVHCRSGSDRSGLAAALYIAAVKHGSEEDAESQLSLRYGHIWFAKEGAMDDSFEALEPKLGLGEARASGSTGG